MIISSLLNLVGTGFLAFSLKLITPGAALGVYDEKTGAELPVAVIRRNWVSLAWVGLAFHLFGFGLQAVLTYCGSK